MKENGNVVDSFWNFLDFVFFCVKMLIFFEIFVILCAVKLTLIGAIVVWHFAKGLLLLVLFMALKLFGVHFVEEEPEEIIEIF